MTSPARTAPRTAPRSGALRDSAPLRRAFPRAGKHCTAAVLLPRPWGRDRRKGCALCRTDRRTHMRLARAVSRRDLLKLTGGEGAVGAWIGYSGLSAR